MEYDDVQRELDEYESQARRDAAELDRRDADKQAADDDDAALLAEMDAVIAEMENDEMSASLQSA